MFPFALTSQRPHKSPPHPAWPKPCGPVPSPHKSQRMSLRSGSQKEVLWGDLNNPRIEVGQEPPGQEAMGTCQRCSGQMLGSLFILNLRKLLAPRFAGNSFHPTNDKTWKFLESKFSPSERVIAPAQGKCSKNPILMNLKGCQNFCINGRVVYGNNAQYASRARL